MTSQILQVTQQVAPMLQAVGDKIGQGAGYFWPIMVKAQFYTGIWEAVGAVICFFGVCLGIKLFCVLAKADAKSGIEYEGLGIFAGFVSVISVIGCLTFSYNAIIDITNPEYGALQNVIQMVKK